MGAAHVSLLGSTCLLSDVNGSTLSGWFLAQGLFNQMSFNKEISNECFDFFFSFSFGVCGDDLHWILSKRKGK